MPRLSQELGVVPWKSRDGQDLVQQFRRCPLHIDSGLNGLLLHPYCSCLKVTSALLELKGMGYLVAFDYFSRYVKVAGMEKTTKSSEIIKALRAIFATHYKRFPKKCDLNKSEFTNCSKE